MRNPFKREKALAATPAVLEAVGDGGWSPYPLLGGGSRQRIQDAFNTAQTANFSWIYRRSPAVRKVVDVIVRNVGQLDLRLYEEIDESERQPRPDHPAALSLRYPSETVSADKLIRSLMKDFLLYDNAYALLTPATGNQISLNRMPAHMVEILGSSMFSVDQYRLHRVDGSFAYLDPGQVLHWSGENPDDPRIGVSRLETLRDVIAEDVALRQAMVELANSGLSEPMWVYRPGDAPQWSNQAREGFEEDLTNRLRRRNGTPPVMEEGMELRGFGVSPRDAQMLEIRRWVTSEVAGVYGVPLGMVGLADNLDEAQSQFYADVLPPYCDDMTKMLNQRILVRVYDWTDGCFEFNLDEKHMGDDRLKTLVSATGRPVMLTNEGRAKLNLPPVDGGDELVTPMNVIVGDNPKPSTDVMPIQDPNAPPQDGSYRTQPPKALTKAAEAIVPLHPSRKGDKDRQDRHIDEAKAVLERHFNRLERGLNETAGRKATGRRRRDDWQKWEALLADDMNKLVKRIVDTEGSIYAFKLAGHFDMGQVANYLKAMADGAAQGFNDKIHEEVDANGVDWAMGRRAQHVESAGAGLGAAATRWAREEAARQSPGAEHRVKVWIPDTDRHAEFGGDTVALGDDWPAGFAPGSAPGCRCSMAIE
jgi:HK97 family phage portal protein